jgi:hypothetical protein
VYAVGGCHSFSSVLLLWLRSLDTSFRDTILGASDEEFRDRAGHPVRDDLVVYRR